MHLQRYDHSNDISSSLFLLFTRREKLIRERCTRCNEKRGRGEADDGKQIDSAEAEQIVGEGDRGREAMSVVVGVVVNESGEVDTVFKS